MKTTVSWSRIQISLLLAYLLSLLPWSENLQPLAPNWLLLCLTYWALSQPHTIGLISAWFWGLLLDVALGSHLGIHALGTAVSVYVTLWLHQRIRMYTPGQQMLYVWLIASLDKLLVLQLENIFGQLQVTASYWLSPWLTAMLWWPALFVLRAFKRQSAPGSASSPS
jgi:rod shape-determining protein MreD